MEVSELYRSDVEKQKYLHAAFIPLSCSDVNLLSFAAAKAEQEEELLEVSAPRLPWWGVSPQLGR